MSEAISESLNGPQSGEKTGFASGEAFAAEADGFCASFEFLPIIFLEATDQTKLRRQFCRAIRGPDRRCSDNFRARRNQEAAQIGQRGTVSDHVVTNEAFPRRRRSAKDRLISQPLFCVSVRMIHLVDLANVEPKPGSDGLGQHGAEGNRKRIVMPVLYLNDGNNKIHR